MSFKQILLIIYIVYIILVSLITFIAYKIDKEKAKSGAIRIQEKTLLFLSAFGGGIGAFFGRKVFHHKTDKSYFSIVIYSSLICEIIVLVLLIIGGVK